ncbi:MAG: hypothetical protein ACFNVM_01535 [Neisseria elongata]
MQTPPKRPQIGCLHPTLFRPSESTESAAHRKRPSEKREKGFSDGLFTKPAACLTQTARDAD